MTVHVQYSVCSNLTWDHMVGEWVHKRQCATLMTMEQHSTCTMKHMYSVDLWDMQCTYMYANATCMGMSSKFKSL